MARHLIGSMLAYCPVPIFNVLTVFFIGFRDFEIRWNAREFIKNLLRKGF